SSMGAPAGYGFQMTCLTTPGNVPVAGYSNLGSNVNQVLLTNGVYNGRTYLEQPTMSVSNQFNFRWTAPASGTGTVRFYAAGNAVNGNNSSAGDKAGSTTLTVNELLPLAQSSVATNPTCADLANGSISLTITGGMMPYQFLWNDGSSSEDRSNLAAGNYSVTITDALGSSINQSFTLTAPPALTATVSVENPLFPDEQAIVDLDVNGGTPGYSISISGIGVVNQFPINLSDGVYSYTVTDANGCITQGTFEAVVPEPLWVDAIIEQVSCNGLSDGSASISISGATPPYSVEWSNGDNDLFSDNLAAGIYDVLVTDAVGYTVLFCVIIEEPETLEAVVSAPEILCFGDEVLASISATGGTAPYQGTGSLFLGAGEFEFLLTDANGCSAAAQINLTEPSPIEITATADAIPCSGGSGDVTLSATGGVQPYWGVGEYIVLTPGLYIYEVSDFNGCAASISVNVPALDGPQLTGTTSAATCSGSCDGSIVVELENGTPPFTAIWQDGFEGLVRENLCAGTYTLEFTDGGGCVIQASYSIVEPAAIETAIDAESIACYGDSVLVEAIATGGAGSYSFVWNGETNSNTYFTGAGTLNLQVTDGTGCSAEFNFELEQPDSLMSTSVVQNLNCFGDANGTIAITAEGGTEPYQINWNGGQSEFELTDLLAGTYSYEITDANGCSASGSNVILQPDELIITLIEVINIDDTGPGSINISVSGGTGTYTYEWSDGSSGEDLLEVWLSGFYTVTVTDENGCEETLESTEIQDWTTIGNSTKLPVIQISPNPAAEQFEITCTEPLTKVHIMTAEGSILTELKGNITEGVDCSTWPAGMYVVVAETADGAIMRRRIIVN
ncbi:MAG: hypothetical protein RL220_1732, partial [Bacteroidota bacterium]